MSEPITIERPSHFICSARCRFGRTTLCDHHYVSSVGDMRYDDNGPPAEIGYKRLYETYVFRWAGKRCEVPGCICGGVAMPDGSSLEVDSLPANTREECEANHAALVAKWLRAPATPQDDPLPVD